MQSIDFEQLSKALMQLQTQHLLSIHRWHDVEKDTDSRGKTFHMQEIYFLIRYSGDLLLTIYKNNSTRVLVGH